MNRLIIGLVLASAVFGQNLIGNLPFNPSPCADGQVPKYSIADKKFLCSTGSGGPAGPAGPVGPAGPAGVDGAPGVPGYSPNSLVSGGGVAWTANLSFTVSRTVYLIGGAQYTANETNITLGMADPANDRIDVIAVDSTGSVVVIPGTPAGPPLKPDIDPATQLELTWVYVAAGAAVPSNVVLDDVYHENVEWTSSQVGGTITLASVNNPHTGLVDVEYTNSVTGNYLQLQAGGPFDLAARNTLVFYIRSKAAWPSTRSLQIYFTSGAARRGSIVVLNESAFGFTSSVTTAYQQIVVPVSLFMANGLTVNRLRFQVAGSGAALGLYLDDITLQGGMPQPVAPTAMAWRGVWSASTAYSVNDVVSYAGISWICTSPPNAAAVTVPQSGSAFWAQLVAPSVITGSFGAVFDGGGSVIPTGTVSYTRVPFACTITGWSILADAINPTATIDVWKIASGAALPTNANTITAAAEPALAAGNAIRSTAIPGWTVTVAADDIVGFNVDALANATWLQIMVICNKT
jgi:hypothetical protein